MLRRYHIAPKDVVIELTEQMPTDDFDLLYNALHHYRDMGFPSRLTTLVPVIRVCDSGRSCARTT